MSKNTFSFYGQNPTAPAAKATTDTEAMPGEATGKLQYIMSGGPEQYTVVGASRLVLHEGHHLFVDEKDDVVLAIASDLIYKAGKDLPPVPAAA